MRRILAALVLGMALSGAMAGPAPAQSLFPDPDRLSRLLDDLRADLGPWLDDLGLDGLGARLDPYLSDLRELLGDLTDWERPEILPNGDILIRRRPTAPAPDQSPEDSPPPVTEPFAL